MIPLQSIITSTRSLPCHRIGKRTILNSKSFIPYCNPILSISTLSYSTFQILRSGVPSIVSSRTVYTRYTHTFFHKKRYQSTSSKPNNNTQDRSERNKVLALYALAGAIAITGLSYAAVPLYKAFCQATGYGGTTQRATEEKFKNMKPVEGGRSITVLFNADTGASMPWIFKPQQRSVKVVPGETALAFYTAYNPTDKPITGVSTYNITPMRAGLYFNKVQCFCFEEQRLRAGEEIDMPIFFYIDPEFLNDPAMNNIKSLTLSYTFFRTGDQEVLDIQDEIRKQDAGRLRIINENDNATAVGNNNSKEQLLSLSDAGKDTASKDRIQQWTQEIAAKTGYNLPTSTIIPTTTNPTNNNNHSTDKRI